MCDWDNDTHLWTGLSRKEVNTENAYCKNDEIPSGSRKQIGMVQRSFQQWCATVLPSNS